MEHDQIEISRENYSYLDCSPAMCTNAEAAVSRSMEHTTRQSQPFSLSQYTFALIARGPVFSSW